MHVDDIEDFEELEDLEAELIDRLAEARAGWGPNAADDYEQAQWDLEDVHRRMQEINPEEGTR